MNQAISKSENIARRLSNLVIERRIALIVMNILLVLLAVNGTKYLEFSTDYRAFFSEENPELMAFENFQKSYTKNDNIIIVLKPADGNIFSQSMVSIIENVTKKSWEIPYASRVDSITNFQYSWASGDDLVVEDLIKNGGNLSAEALLQKKKITLNEPLLLNSLISDDADTTAINITLQFPGKSLNELPSAVNNARAIADEIREQYPDIQVALSGIAMLNSAFSEAGQQDSKTLIPIMYLVLLAIMLISMRSAAGTFVTLLVIVFSSVVAMGLAGYIGIKLTPLSITAPTIILTLAIADSVHLLLSMQVAMSDGMDKIAAIKESVRINFLPVTITSVTTVIGFLTLNFSDAPPFWHLGNITAMGICAAWLVSLTFLPALISFLPIKPKKRTTKKGLSNLLGHLSVNITNNSKLILVSFFILTVAALALIPQININDEFSKYFDERVEFRRDFDFANKHLTSGYIIEFSLGASNPGAISEPEYLQGLDSFTHWLRQQPEVLHVFSYSDIIKRLNKNMHGDDEDWYRIPDNRNQAAQYLLLYEISLPYGLDLADRITVSKQATRVTVTVNDTSTVETQYFVHRAESWLRANTPSYMHGVATGAPVMFSHIFERNAKSMIKGNIVAIVAITLLMIVVLRSFVFGAISIIPNAIPILVTFGAWGLLVGEVGLAAATVTSTSLGIVVDNTVHFLTKYLRARRERNLSPPDAIRYAFETVGEAIVITTFMLAGGFAILATSTFLVNSQMGLLTAIIIVAALIVDFLLLPAILMIGHKKGQFEHEENSEYHSV